MPLALAHCMGGGTGPGSGANAPPTRSATDAAASDGIEQAPLQGGDVASADVRCADDVAHPAEGDVEAGG